MNYNHRPFCPRGVLLLAGLLLPAAFACAQQTTTPDSARVSYGEEVLTQPLRVDTVLLREDRGMWKLGLNNFTTGQSSLYNFYTRYGVHLAYERKLGAAWAVQGEVSPAVVRYRRADGALRRAPSARVQLMGRYYYNLERRIRKGKNLGSFSGNYFALAVGAGLGRHTRDTPFYFYYTGRDNHGLADIALLYGLQRRLGRRGFIDANVGLTQLVAPVFSDLQLNASLRVGLVLGGAPPVERMPARLGAAEDATLRPRYYGGVQLGSYNYVVRFSNVDPYAARPGGSPSFFQTDGVGTYSVENKNPYLYVGYQLRPRLALQLGYQGQAGTLESSASSYSGSGPVQLGRVNKTYTQTLAFPLLLRYNLARQYQQRVQFDAVGGVAATHARVRHEETRYRNGQATETFSFARQTTGAHVTGGLDVSYGIGRRRRLQLTGEYVLIQSLQKSFTGLRSVEAGGSLGVRYRFGPTF